MANITEVIVVCNNIEKEDECLATESLVKKLYEMKYNGPITNF